MLDSEAGVRKPSGTDLYRYLGLRGIWTWPPIIDWVAELKPADRLFDTNYETPYVKAQDWPPEANSRNPATNSILL